MFTRLIAVNAALLAVAIVTTAGGQAPRAQTTGRQTERFDTRVRADFFAGLAGNEEAFARAMRLLESTLAERPDHPEALVWHGSGLLFQAGQAFEKGDMARGTGLWERGLKEMDAGVASDPENVAVLIPRGATLLEASKRVPAAEQSRELLTRGVSDYENVLRLQSPYFAALPVHAKGELLLALADGVHRLGDSDKAVRYFQRLIEETRGSEYEKRARAWLDGGPSDKAAAGRGCIGCHAGGRREPAGREDSTRSTVLVRLSGFKHDNGAAMIALTDAKGFLADTGAIRAEAVSIRNGQAECIFRNVPHGNYAIQAYHDENGNQRLDSNVLGIPSEPYGFSRGARGTFGPPKYRDAEFSVAAAEMTIDITVQ